jgi:hypothetical protein
MTGMIGTGMATRPACTAMGIQDVWDGYEGEARCVDADLSFAHACPGYACACACACVALGCEVGSG